VYIHMHVCMYVCVCVYIHVCVCMRERERERERERVPVFDAFGALAKAHGGDGLGFICSRRRAVDDERRSAIPSLCIRIRMCV
jgi:hypothetical protein